MRPDKRIKALLGSMPRVVATRPLVNALADQQAALERVEKELAACRKTLERLEESRLSETRWRDRFLRKVDALLRREYLDEFLNGSFPFQILARRFKLMSQNEEDGVLLALLRIAGVTTRKFVDIGCGSNGGNSGLLASEFGWTGLMVDAREAGTERCRERFLHNPNVKIECRFVTPDNIDALITEAGLAGEVDSFSLDIDSFDYWVFDAMTACNPRVLVLEYNGFFGPELSVTIPKDADLSDGPKGYHGASLKALTKLAARKGYRLVACDEAGINAFFLRNDLRPDLAGIAVAEAFRPMRERNDPEKLRENDVIQRVREKGLPFTEV